MEDIAIAKPKKPKIKVDKQVLEDAKTQTDLEKQVIVHCHLKAEFQDISIRIWNSTYLRDQESSHKSKLLNAFNISLYPTWKHIFGSNKANFTLVFSALPKDCTSFDLFEDIPQGGGFFTGLISRNKTDVYSVEICA